MPVCCQRVGPKQTTWFLRARGYFLPNQSARPPSFPVFHCFNPSHQSRFRPELLSEPAPIPLLSVRPSHLCASSPTQTDCPSVSLRLPANTTTSSTSTPAAAAAAAAPTPTLPSPHPSLFSQCLARKAFVDNWLVEGGDRCCVCLDWELSHFLPASLSFFPPSRLLFLPLHSSLCSPRIDLPTPSDSPKMGFEGVGVGVIRSNIIYTNY